MRKAFCKCLYAALKNRRIMYVSHGYVNQAQWAEKPAGDSSGYGPLVKYQKAIAEHPESPRQPESDGGCFGDRVHSVDS